MRRLVALTAALLVATLVMAPASSAGEITPVGAVPATNMARYQQWLDESLMPTPDTFRIDERACPEMDAQMCYLPKTNTVVFDFSAYLFEDPDNYSWEGRESTKLWFLHEVGHALVFRSPNRKFQRVWARTFVPSTMSPDLTPDPADVWFHHEHFAMAYAYCSVDRYIIAPHIREIFTAYNWEPTNAQHRRSCRFIANLDDIAEKETVRQERRRARRLGRKYRPRPERPVRPPVVKPAPQTESTPGPEPAPQPVPTPQPESTPQPRPTPELPLTPPDCASPVDGQHAEECQEVGTNSQLGR